MSWTPRYVGFVLSKGHPVRMVDLGPAQPIEDAISRWRQAIVGGQESPAAADLRKLVWEPLAAHFPKGTTTVYVAPDGSLSFIPWAALPGDRPGTVLLEQYALATIPHAPFLLDRLTAFASSAHDRTAGLLLAVGGVAYGQKPKSADDEATRLKLLAARPAEIERGESDGWPDLPGTLEELDDISRLAAPRTVLRLQGAEAGTARLLQELPRARWAHIGTHGFFANPSIRSVLTPDPRLFGRLGTERVGAGLRNPLVLSGLVLAGANLPGSGDDLLAHDDRGILTAEAIAGLDLAGLDLVVLSACETGLGLVSGGEGVFSLQRAFHMAGAHNVVASLWKASMTRRQRAHGRFLRIQALGAWAEPRSRPSTRRSLRSTVSRSWSGSSRQRAGRQTSIVGGATWPVPSLSSDGSTWTRAARRRGSGRRLCSQVTDVKGSLMRGHATRPIVRRLKAVLILLGVAINAIRPLATVASPAEPLRGILHLRVHDRTEPQRRNRRLDRSGVLPLKSGDRFSIEARLNRPAYLYLFWVGSDAKVAPIYPWRPGHWDKRPAEERRLQSLELPAQTDKAWEIPAGVPGIETLLLLVREESPLLRKDEEPLARLLGRAWLASEILIKEAVWLENGREITIDPLDRTIPSSKPRQSDDPVLGIRRLLQEKVWPLGDYYQAIVFPNQGGT